MLQELCAAKQPFTSQDYMLPTPHWAVFGAAEAGFDPHEERHVKHRNHPAQALES